MSILEKVKALNLPKGQYVVMGSAILELKGIRKAGDLDIIVTKELFEKLKNDPAWEYKREFGEVGGVEVEELDNHHGVELYWNIYGGGIMENFLKDPTEYEEIEGIYFANLKSLLNIKDGKWNREKDRTDAELIKRYLAQQMQQSSQIDFDGVKVAVLVDGKLLVILRDNKPGLFMANMWDFPGGGREGDESPEESAIREIKEELNITLTPHRFVWKREHPSLKNPGRTAYFLVAQIDRSMLNGLVLNEGQRWDLFDINTFFQKDDAIPALKERLKSYLDAQ